MEQTQNYQLNLWEGEDRILREDFNADNMKTEQALAEQAELLAKCGNCRIVTTSYTGTGEYGENHPNTLSFDAVPALVLIIARSSGGHMILSPGQEESYFSVGNECRVTWNGSTVSWYSHAAMYQGSSKGTVFSVVAFLPQE